MIQCSLERLYVSVCILSLCGKYLEAPRKAHIGSIEDTIEVLRSAP